MGFLNFEKAHSSAAGLQPSAASQRLTGSPDLLDLRADANWQIGKFIGSYGYTAKGHQYQAAGGRPVKKILGGLSRS